MDKLGRNISSAQDSGRVCWADLVDEQTTDPGDSPRSVSSLSCENACETQVALGRTLWADMEDSDSEYVEEICGAADDKLTIRTMTGERSIAQDRLHVRESVQHVSTYPRTHSRERDIPPRPNASRRKGFSNDVGKGSGKNGLHGSWKGAPRKGAGKGHRGKHSDSKSAANEKFQCQFFLGIEEDSRFRVARRVLGEGGENMKRIASESGAKLRLRGRGSKFLEGPEKKESEDDLMLCVSCQDAAGFEIAKRAVSDLIEVIHQDYQTFCWKAGHACPLLELKINGGYRVGSRFGGHRRR
jgi:hypothetical protein